MKLKLTQIVNSYSVLMRVGQEKMPVKLAYNFQRNMRLLEPEAVAFEKQRVELIKSTYGVEDENKNWSVPVDKQEEFGAEIKELGEVEVEIDVHTVKVDDVTVMISPNDLFILDWMFVESVGIPEAK